MRAKGPPLCLPDADKDVDTLGRDESLLSDSCQMVLPTEIPHNGNNNNNALSFYGRLPHRTPRKRLDGSHYSNPGPSHPYLHHVGKYGLRDSPPPLPRLVFDSGPGSVVDPPTFDGHRSSTPSESEIFSVQTETGSSHLLYAPVDATVPDNREMLDLNSNSEFGYRDLQLASLPRGHTLRETPSSSPSAPPHQNPLPAPLPTNLPLHLHQLHHSARRHSATHGSLSSSSTARNWRRSSTSKQERSSNNFDPSPNVSTANTCNNNSKSGWGRASLLPSVLGSLAHLKLEGEEDISQLVVALRTERSRLLKEIVQEDEERSAFYSHLESLNKRLRVLPQQYNVGCERYRVEGEMCRIQEALSERLGPPAVMLRRRDQRLHAINAIEKTIQRLRQEKPLPSSSNCSRDRVVRAAAPTSSSSHRHEPIDSDRTGSVDHSTTMDFVNANQLRDELPPDDPSAAPLQPSTTPPNPHDPGLSQETLNSETGVGETPPIHPTIEAVLRGAWPFEKALWHSSPASVGVSYKNGTPETTPGIMSTSSVTNRRAQSQQQLLTNKVEMVYGLLSMFSSGDRDDMSRTLLAMSSSPDSCVAMRQSGCLPLLIQLLHGSDDTPPTREARLRAAQGLHNIVHSHPDDKRGRREARVLRLLEQLRDYSDSLWEKLERLCAGRGPLLEDAMEKHPGPAMAALMKLSFDEEHRHAMCLLGGLHAIAELIRRDHEAHGSQTADQYCTTLRRYAGMALTNLTFGDGTNKALLCSFRSFMRSLVSQLHSPSEELRQVTASVLRNLSWRADGSSKTSLRDVGAVSALTQAALTAKKESTLKVILSAVWNLSAHCSMNKADICAVEGALAFICSTLTYKSASKTLSIIENGGGILRNISSHIAVKDDLRQVLRDHNTLSVLLSQLRSPSLTVVSNACGTLWNLSARCPHDQASLWNLGAVPMLRSLINSKHKMISMGSSAALKNLLQARPEGTAIIDGRHGLGLPSLQARKQKALEQELDPSLAETCDNIEASPRASPTTTQPDAPGSMFHSLGHYHNGMLSDSRDSVMSTHSDKTHDRMQQMLLRHHSGREYQAGGEYPIGGPLDDPAKDPQFGPNGNKFKNLADSDVASKVTNLGNKYCNGGSTKGGKSAGTHFNDKPTPQIDNYVKEETQERVGDKDLDEDQPTDFSLRYAEDGEELGGVSSGQLRQHQQKASGEKRVSEDPSQHPSRNGFFEPSSFHEDSLRTFYTEGTPYNFSIATSLSDLREIDGRTSNKNKRDSIEDLDLEELNDSDQDLTTKEDKRSPKLVTRSSRLSLPASSDKPVTYCVEGTPVSLSRISSVSSISSEEIDEHIEKELLEVDDEDENDVTTERINLVSHPATALPSAAPERSSVHSTERFTTQPTDVSHQPQGENHLQVCDQTPLMFSRATSVSSLSSFEIQSIHDDRSSVVSDFSRMASGVVSPSDLPDSPCQTVPTSPKRGRAALPPPHSVRNAAPTEPRHSTGVFRDAPRFFNDEGTPAEFSHATSLSSLTFDEEEFPPRTRGDGKDSTTTTTTTSERSQQSSPLMPRPSRDPTRSSIPRPHTRSQDPEGWKRGRDPSREGRPAPRTSSEGPPPIRKVPKSPEASDDEMRLAALIQSGMPAKKPAPKAPTTAPVAASRAAPSGGRTSLTPALPPPPPPLSSGGVALGSAIPIQTPNLQVTVQAINFNSVTPPPKTEQSGSWSSAGDSVRAFCTEGTPATISTACSSSDLSQLSRLTSSSTSDVCPKGAPGTESADSDESLEGKRLLEKCIRSGMPKPKSNQRTKELGSPAPKDRPLLSPRRSPHHRPVPVARVSPAIKVGVVNPQVNSLKSPTTFPAEELRTYAVEGTPVEFSPAASLSDLTIDTPPYAGLVKKGKSHIPAMKDQSIKSVDPQEEFVSPQHPKQYPLEDTLSSVSSNIEVTEAERRMPDEDVKCYGVEGTPVLYSHNSSLSSLSIEPPETTPREEALLRRCINQGMPKGPPSRIPQVASLNRGIPSRVTPGVAMPHLLLNQSSPHSSTSSLTSEAESRKLHTENEESEKQNPRQKLSPVISANEDSSTDITSENSSAVTMVPARGDRLESSPSPEEPKQSSPDPVMEQSTPSSGSVEMKSEGSLSESQALLAEALKLAKAVSRDGAKAAGSSDETSIMSASVASASSACIDLIKPPSAMGSLLSLSTSSVEESRVIKQTPKKLECRHTKKMPEMVRRALGEYDVGAECPSLGSSCHSNIDNIMPPSLMDDDMESSMISVASITSEVVEPRDSSPVGDGHSEVAEPARQIASLLQREAQACGTSSLTLTAGDEVSTCQEITDLDVTLGAHQLDGTGASDTEVAVDDLPHDIPDLPLDSPLRQRGRESSPKLTPNQRHSQLRDRFRTFTRESSSPESSRETPESPGSPAVQRTLRQRRFDDAERFRTRTISYEAPFDSQQDTEEIQEQINNGEVDAPGGRIVPVRNGDALGERSSARRSFRQRRSDDPSRYHTRTIHVPMTDITQETAGKKHQSEVDIVEFHDGEDLCLTAAQMEVLNQDANIVICCLNETREGMTLSDAADFPEENILDIETLSLISNEDEEEEMLQLLVEENTFEDLAARGPRIVKPGEERPRHFDEPPLGKGIRGKRRALYPMSKHQSHTPCAVKQQQTQGPIQFGARPSALNPLPFTRAPPKQITTSPKQPRATRASTLRQTSHSRGGGSSSEDSPRQSSSPASSAGSSPKLGGVNRGPVLALGKAKSKETLHSLRRQNTFTKDDAEADKAKNGPRTKPAKGRVRKDSVQPTQLYTATTLANDWGSRAKFAPRKSTSLTREACPPTSAKDVAEWEGLDNTPTKGGSKIAKKDVTSRIANLWKRVEKAQGASKAPTNKGKDDRVWISGTDSRNAKEILPPNRSLVRSSTFEKETQSMKNGRSGLGLKLSRLKGRDTRSSPPSEVSTPVDSRPHCLVSPTRITPRPRPATHPSATPRSTHHPDITPDGAEKRLSRLGSFIVVDEQEDLPRGRAVVAPFSYRDGDPPQRASSMTRIPQPSKPLQNKPRDDNGNAAVIN